MEESGHELCFISHPKYDRRISCDVFGNLRMCEAWKGWEIWRFIKDDESGNFIITSWTHDHKVLCSNEKGRVFTAEKKKLLEDGTLKLEEWKISTHPRNHGVGIQSVEHGRFLAFSGHDLCTMDKEEDTTWHLEPAHGHRFFISATCHDRRLSSTNDHPFTHHNRKHAEKWLIEPTNDEIGKFTIRSQEHGKYLGSQQHRMYPEIGKLFVSESRQHWTISSSPHGGVFIQSVDHGVRLSCDDKGHLNTTKSSGGWETWRLEPIMPGTINGKQLVGIGVTTVTIAFAMPFAVVGVVGAMGFGAEGIAANSIAAWMMSTGGSVATLQSVGAAGLSAAGASAAATTGAAVGGLASLRVVTASKGLDNGQDGIKLEEPAEKHLPLCSWRMWK